MVHLRQHDVVGSDVQSCCSQLAGQYYYAFASALAFAIAFAFAIRLLAASSFFTIAKPPTITVSVMLGYPFKNISRAHSFSIA
jgi:hypothetical protein